MTDLLCDIEDSLFIITFNRLHKHNAFDNSFLENLQDALNEGINNPQIRVILIKANGPHFSAGADLAWMQRMITFSEEDNFKDALILANVMKTLHNCPKPTLAVVQGSAFGGGAGLVSACDIAIASKAARFCFSEVKLGLVPAIISPYVVKALGARTAKWLFMSAEIIDAEQARQFQLVQFCLNEETLWPFSLNYAKKLTTLAPDATRQCKVLVDSLSHRAITDELITETVHLIAKKRVSAEGQHGLQAFLNKQKPNWS